MAYPNRWVASLDAARAGAVVQLREEMVPVDDNGVFVPPGDDVLVNTDINYNNSKLYCLMLLSGAMD